MMRGERAPVIFPNRLSVNEVLGLLNCGVLNKLKNSARYCRRKRSVMWRFFMADQSRLKVPGPRKTPRPELPKVPSFARAKEEILKYCLIRSPRARSGDKW